MNNNNIKKLIRSLHHIVRTYLIIKNLNIKLSYNLKLEEIIKAQKDLPNYSKKNLVYKISCKNCDAIYVGQTKRKLNTRISEH